MRWDGIDKIDVAQDTARGEFLHTRQRTFGFRKTRRIWLAEELLASQEEFGSMGLFSSLISKS